MIKFFIVSLLTLFLTGCASEIKDDFFAMDTYMTAQIYGTQADADAVKSEIYRLDSLLRWDKINLDNAEVKALMSEAEALKSFTGGAFDVSVAPFLELWGFRDKSYRVPSDWEIQEVFDSHRECIDFGGIGKGYAGKKVRELLLSRGVKSGVISLGGNIQTVGEKPDGTPWKIGIQNPEGDGYVCFVEVADEAVVTSGGYHRFFEADDRKYSHIINPSTGRPAETDVKSVTVISKDGTIADALSTAFYVMGSEGTKDFCKRVQYKYNETDFAVIIVDNQNKIQSLGNVKCERNN